MKKNIVIHNIPIELEKKRIKNMYLRILPPDGQVHISAPIRMTEDEIYGFVTSRLDWIVLQQGKLKQRPMHQELSYVTGERVTIWGRSYTLLVREAFTRSRVEVIEDDVIIYSKSDSTKEQREKTLKQWYKKNLDSEIPFLLARWENNIGVKSSSYRIQDMKTRWGTCNVRTKGLCFNLQLVTKPEKCLEYVVIHELVHLLERSHNAVFKGYMDRFLPEWRSIKKELNGME